MDIRKIRTLIDEVLHEIVYVDNELDEETSKKYDEIINYFKNKDYIYDDLKAIFTDRNNDNLIPFNDLITKILVRTKESVKLDILNDEYKYNEIFKDYEIFYDIWNSLKKKVKLEYFQNKNKYTDIDVFILNTSIKKYNSYRDNIVFKDIIFNDKVNDKIPPYSIDMIYSYNVLSNINLNNYSNCVIFTRESFTTLLLKKCRSFTEFYNIYEINGQLFNLINNNSLIFKNKDNNIIHEFLLKNPNYISKFHTKYLDVFNIMEITKLSKLKSLDNYTYSLIVQKLYSFDESKADTYFSEDNLKRFANHSINIYPFNNIKDELRNKIFNNYILFSKFSDTIIVETINNYFKEEEILNLLRDNVFINDISDYAIELLINRLSFKSVFNMLQRKEILDKINNINIELNENDSVFFKGYLDSPSLVNKTVHNMLYNMLLYFNKDEIMYYITSPYVANKITNSELINLAVKKNIRIEELLESLVLQQKLTRNDLINYVNKSWEINIDLDIFKNKELCMLLFNLTNDQLEQINFEEVNYLFENVRMKSVLSTQVTKYSLLTYKSVLCSYLVFGLNETIELVQNGNKGLKLDEVKELQKVIVNEKLLNFRENNASLIQNIAKKVRTNLLSLNNYNDVASFARQLRKNTYLDNILFLMLDANYDTYNNIIELFYNNLKYYDFNEYQSKKELYEYCNGFVNRFINNKYCELNNEFEEIILKNFKLRENVLYNKRKELGKEFLDKLKLKIFVRALTDSKKDSYVFAFNDNYPIDDIRERFIKYLNHDEVDFDSITDHVLTPLMNERFDKDNCLSKLNIIKPSNYDEYYDYMNDLKLVTILNNEVEKLKKVYKPEQILEIMNHICYGANLSFDVSAKDSKLFNRLIDHVESLTGQLYVDKSKMKYIYSDTRDIYNVDEIIEYNNYINILDEIINKTKNYIRKNMNTERIKNYYSHDYLSKINNYDFVLPINNKNYELKQRVFSLTDLENIFNGYDLTKFSKANKKLIKFLLADKNLIMVADGYYKGVVDDLGLIMSNYKMIETECKELNIDIDDTNIINLENILKLSNFDFDVIINNIDNDVIRDLCGDNYYIEADMKKRLKIAKTLFEESLKKVSSSVPYVSFKDNEYEVSIVDNYNQEIFKSFKESIYKIGCLGSDFLHYVILDKNGFKVVIDKDGKTIARILGVRNGNTLYLNKIEGIKDENYENLLRQLGERVINFTKSTNEPIEFVIIVNNDLLDSKNGLRVDNVVCPVIDNPINTMYADYDDYKAYKYLYNVSDDGFYNNYPDNYKILVASSKVVDKNNFKYYDPESLYLRNRNPVLKLSNNIEDMYINKLDMIIALCKKNNLSEYDGDIVLSTIDSIYLGDDFVVFVTANKQIIKYVLQYDKRVNAELELVLKSINQ